jgi:ribonucleoside-diphosphate reductase alpha chain
MYMLAWKKGLKTTYYLRTLGATAPEKSTLTDGSLNAVGNGMNSNGQAHANGGAQAAADESKQCLIDDSVCESCQ